jgi:DHA3 family macrolide efflux protein-like MFS transporter
MHNSRKQNTAFFLTGQALSFFGTMTVPFVIPGHRTLKTRSGLMMTLFTVAGFLSLFFISPFAGVTVEAAFGEGVWRFSPWRPAP